MRIVALMLALVLWGTSPAFAQYEVLQAFEDAPPRGPDKAHGIVIWNHGVHGQQDRSTSPPPNYVRALYAANWDVIRIARNSLHESNWATAGLAHVARTIEEVERVKAQGYKRVILAGQSYGGAITLEAARRVPVYAIVPSAPGTGVSERELGSVLASTHGTEQMYTALAEGKFERAVAILPYADEYSMSAPERGRRAREIMAKRDVPYLPLDDASSRLVAHGASASALMTFAYGDCVAAFLDPARPAAPGLAQCGKDGLPSSPDLLADMNVLKPAAMPAGEWWKSYEGIWTGTWSDPALVAVALEKSETGYDFVYLYGEKGTQKTRVAYRAPATLNGRAIVAQLPHQTVTLDFDLKIRQVKLTWNNKEGRSGWLMLRSYTPPS